MLRKHLYYLTSDQLCAYRWEGGRLTPDACFANDRAGLNDFMDHVDAQPHGPVYLLADLIEEDFQRVQLPHVQGRAGARLLERRLLQQYRESPYRHARIQGRAAEGRQDDSALLCALTNPSLVAPWLEALAALKTPVAGLYSTTLLSDALLRKLELRHEHLLLVTQQSGGLRQSYFLDGQLKFSRLTLAVDRDGAPVNVAAETDKTQQFLTSIRLLGRGHLLHTVIVTPRESIARLAPLCQNGPETSYQFIAMETAAAKVGLARAPALADTLLLHLLGTQTPSNQYAPSEARRYFQLWRARLAMYGLAAAVMGTGLLWVGANVWRYVEASTAADHLGAEADQYDARYRDVMSNMPPRVAKTANMKAAVTIDHMLAEQAPTPLAMMRIVSAALERVPQIRLTQLDWRVNLPGAKAAPAPGTAAPAAMESEAAAAPVSSLLLGIPGKPAQALHLEAEITMPQTDYRAVLATMNQFAQLLAGQPRLLVEIEAVPLDVRSNVKLSGKAGNAAADEKAKFSLNLGWTP